jgi:5-methylcytosine-specific restriction protein A
MADAEQQFEGAGMSREVPEWVGKNADQAIPPNVRDRVYTRGGEKCAICTRPIDEKLRPAIDHIIAIINGGKNAESNLQLLCVPCHAVKTKADVAEKSTVYRKRMKDRGLTKPSRFPGSRASGLKKRMDGSVVRR